MSKAFILHFSSLWCTSNSICTLYIRTSTGLCDFNLALNFNVYRSTTNILSNNKSCGKQLLHVDWRGTVACRLYSLSCIHRSRFQWDWCHGHARPQQLPQWKCGAAGHVPWKSRGNAQGLYWLCWSWWNAVILSCYGWMSTPKGWFLRIPPKKILKKYEFNETRWTWNEFKWILHIFSQATFQRRSRDPHLKIGSLACPLRHGDTTVVTIRWRSSHVQRSGLVAASKAHRHTACRCRWCRYRAPCYSLLD